MFWGFLVFFVSLKFRQDLCWLKKDFYIYERLFTVNNSPIFTTSFPFSLPHSTLTLYVLYKGVYILLYATNYISS